MPVMREDAGTPPWWRAGVRIGRRHPSSLANGRRAHVPVVARIPQTLLMASAGEDQRAMRRARVGVTAAFAAHAVLSGLLGPWIPHIKAQGGLDAPGLRIDPCLPTDWEGYEAVRPFRGATYRISVRKPRGLTGRITSLLVDGRQIDGNVVAAAPEGADMTIEGTVV